MLQLLIEANANVNNAKCWVHDGWTPLHTAVAHGNIEAARLLVDAKADLHAEYWNREDDNEETPLDLCRSRGMHEHTPAWLALLSPLGRHNESDNDVESS